MTICGKRVTKEKAMSDLREMTNALINELLDLEKTNNLTKDQIIALRGTVNGARGDLRHKIKSYGFKEG